MENILPIIVAVIAIGGVIMLLSFISGKKASKGKNVKANRQKGRAAIIRDATRKLASNPHNPNGLLPLANLYYTENLYDKAYPLYTTLVSIAPAHTQIDAFLVSLRQGVCAMQLGKTEEALKSLTAAYAKNPDDFEAAYNLGNAFYKTNVFEKAIPCFKKALINKPDATDAFSLLGLSFYKMKRYKDSLPWLKKALDVSPEDKELLFSMADAMHEAGYSDKALKVFMHLRVDQTYGARSSLLAGMIHLHGNDIPNAILDFEIGIKHTDAPADIMLEIKYRLATCYLNSNQTAKGLELLRSISVANNHYKDVPALISRYQELNQNSNLQIYLTAATSDFVALCRKIVAIYFAKSTVRVLDINVETVCTEILTEIETAKWEDVAIFRFYRTTGSTGELYIRDFHGKLRDAKAGRGICITAGTFSEEAKKFADGRPIDLVEKTSLIQILKKVH